MAYVIGHRGAKSLAPENTLQGIRAAALCKADCVELDVRLSRSGDLVLMHDENVDRTTNGKGLVQDMSLEELKALDVDGYPVPTLREALTLAEELGLGQIVEMKEEGLEELVAESLTGKNCIVTSFYHSSLREFKELSDISTGIIISSLPIKPVELALWAKADAIFPRRVNPRLFKEAHQKDLKVYPWTINKKDEALWLLRLGADGLVTDDPCLIRKAVDEPLKLTGKGNCEYYPCHHFSDQDCTHCFCPLYPCKDAELGKFVRTKKGKRFWTCIDCNLVHKPYAANYLRDHPETSTLELKSLEK